MKTGSLVISLDFELIWGIYDLQPSISKREEILKTRKVVPMLLNMFKKYDIHATWATVGFLFFESRNELMTSLPTNLPNYENKSLLPYEKIKTELGESEKEDPLYYAPSLIQEILLTPNQELATHTFSHYYCLENGQTLIEFDSDINAAIQIAQKYNMNIKSIVFPRNQYSPEYLDICFKRGILTFRGNENIWFRKTAKREAHRKPFRRILRLLDTYINISGHNIYFLPKSTSTSILNIPASRYLRSYSKKGEVLEPLRLKRIIRFYDCSS